MSYFRLEANSLSSEDSWKVSDLLSTLQMKKTDASMDTASVKLWAYLLWDRDGNGLSGERPMLCPPPHRLVLSPRLRCRSKTRGSCSHWGIFPVSWRSCVLRVPNGTMPGPAEGHPPSELEQVLKAEAASPHHPGGWPSSSKGQTADEAPSLNWLEMPLGLNPTTTS